MKILYFTQLFYPALFGGGEFIFYQWALELVKRGHQVCVITQRLEGTSSHEIINGIEIFRVGSVQRQKGNLPTGIGSNLSFLIGSFLAGIKIGRKNKIDVIHSNTYIPVFAAYLCSKLLNIPHIATVHDVYYSSRKDFWKNWSEQDNTSTLTQFLGPVIEKVIANLSVTLFHTVSEQSKSDLLSLGVKKKIIVIPNGIDPTNYEIETSNSKNQAIFVGRLVFYKNVETIIEAFSKVAQKIPDSKLVIVGDGPQRSKLQEKVRILRLERNVSFTGQISEKEKIKLISQSKMLLNPSLVEGFGIVVLEGFACGKPVIVSDSKPLSDLVNDSTDGFVVSSLDDNEWAGRIIDLFLNPLKTQEMGLRGKEKISTDYAISKLVNDLMQLYESVRNKPRKE